MTMPRLSKSIRRGALAALAFATPAAAQTPGGGHGDGMDCAHTGPARVEQGQLTREEWIARQDQALLEALSGSADCINEAFRAGQESQAAVAGGRPQVVIKRDPHGHYLSHGHINHQPVSFLLDTGATVVAIPQHIAQRLGLRRGAKISAVTANGTVDTYATRLDSIGIGAIELQNVDASINPHSHSDDILLGMSFLRQLELVQKGDTLTLRQ